MSAPTTLTENLQRALDAVEEFGRSREAFALDDYLARQEAAREAQGEGA